MLAFNSQIYTPTEFPFTVKKKHKTNKGKQNETTTLKTIASPRELLQRQKSSRTKRYSYNTTQIR